MYIKTGCLLSFLALFRPLLGQSSQLLGRSGQSPWVRATHQGLSIDSDLIAILEEHECRHRGDVVLSRDVLRIINVDLGETKHAPNAVLLREVGVYGRDCLARSAPVRVEVNNHICRGGEELLQFGEGADMV